MSIWIDSKGRINVGVQVRKRRVHRILPMGSTQADAKRIEAEIRSSVARGPEVVIPGDPLLSVLMEAYCEYAAGLRSEDTAIHHANRISDQVSRFRASQARECAAAIIDELGDAYAAATLNRSLGCLKKALTLAWERGKTPENWGLRIKALKVHNERHTYLSIDQVRSIATHCSMPVQAAIWTALLTGARRGEVCQIRPEHIREDHIEIPASHTKTLRYRAVPIVEPLRPWLKHFPLEVNFEGIKSAWRRARVKAGLPGARYHDLRHSCASIMVGLGVDLFTVGEILGHSSTQTTKRYAHLQLDRKADALRMLGQKMHSEMHSA